jgi:phasin family protein
MANPRQEDKSSQKIEESVRQTGERTGEQASRVGQTAFDTSGKMAEAGTDASEKMGRAGADASNKVAQAGADLVQQNAQALQNAWRTGIDMFTTMMDRSKEQLDRSLGLSGNEAQQATERTARNAEVILSSTTAASNAISGLSREYFELARHQMEKSMEQVQRFPACRTPQEFAAAHSDFVREMMAGAFESSRRLAEMSMKFTDDAAKRVTENMERHAA